MFYSLCCEDLIREVESDSRNGDVAKFVNADNLPFLAACEYEYQPYNDPCPQSEQGYEQM